MSAAPTAKAEKPTLAGASIKTRKRNIAVPLDPGSFANAIVQIFEDTNEPSNTLDKNLEAAAKVLDSAELDFKRYGETFFEVFFAGGRMLGGGNLAEGPKLSTNILACEPNKEAVIPYIRFFQNVVRRKPFLIQSLENTMTKLIMSMDFFDAETRKKLAIAMSRTFVLKVGVLPDRVLVTLLNDRLVPKGTMRDFATDMFTDFLSTESLEELMSLLRKAKIDGRLLDIFPPNQRTDEALEEHFKAAGLDQFAEYHRKKMSERQLEALTDELSGLMVSEPPAPAADCVKLVTSKKQEQTLPDQELVKSVWNAVMKSVPMSGRTAQQITTLLMKQIKVYSKVLSSVCTNGKLELTLLVTIQVQCYEDSKLLKAFKDIVRLLYDLDVVQEDTIKFWYTRGSATKGRNVFLKDLEPFIKWLEEAEEEESD